TAEHRPPEQRPVCAGPRAGGHHSAAFFANALNVDVDFCHGHIHRALNFELDGLLQIVRDLGDPDPVLHDHVDVDREPVLELDDVDALVGVLPAHNLRDSVAPA